MAAVAARIATRGRTLAAIQIVQVGSGLLGQIILLARWSPHQQTDLFLLLSSLPWLISAALLVSGLEMVIPAIYLQAKAAGGEADSRRLVAQVSGLCIAAGLVAALVGAIVVAVSVHRAGLSLTLSLWMGLALGGQALPAALGGLWRGLLVAEDRLIQARFVLLVGSLITVIGYGLLPGPPALALPLSAVSAVIGMAVLAWFYLPDLPFFPVRYPEISRSRISPYPPDLLSPVPGERRRKSSLHAMGRGFRRGALFQSGDDSYPIMDTSFHPAIKPLLRALLALSAAAGLAHLGTIIERGAVLSLGTGTVASLAVAGRGWEAVQAVIVAACVLPAYPRWADPAYRSERHDLLIWSLRHTALWTFAAAGSAGIDAWLIGPHLGWQAGSRAAQMALVLLPRFFLLCCIQPLVLKCFAAGTPWPPVIGSALGLVVLGIGAWIVVPRWELVGFACVAALSVLPGWLVLIRHERRDSCAF